MAKIKHIALSVQDPEKTAKFYEEVFGLQRVGTTESVLASGVYLSDGEINIALLNYKSDEMSGMAEAARTSSAPTTSASRSTTRTW